MHEAFVDPAATPWCHSGVYWVQPIGHLGLLLILCWCGGEEGQEDWEGHQGRPQFSVHNLIGGGKEDDRRWWLNYQRRLVKLRHQDLLKRRSAETNERR